MRDSRFTITLLSLVVRLRGAPASAAGADVSRT